MITILAIGPALAQISRFASGHPAVEIMTAGGTEEALEKLARNRRIDAVLLLPGAPAREIAEAIRQEDPASPPLFASVQAGSIDGVHTAGALEPEGLIEWVIEHLSEKD
jgi:DNA-binding NarL/FixJ family response regulator